MGSGYSAPWDKYHAKDVQRLISSLYPTGRVVWQDDFEATLLKWKEFAFSGGSGGGIARDTTKAYRESASLKISSGTTESGGYEANKDFGRTGNMRMGIEFHWARTYDLDHKLQAGIEWRNGVNAYQAMVYYHDKMIRIMTPAGVVTLDTLGEDIEGYDRDAQEEFFFHHLKLTANFDKAKYGMLFFDDEVYDLCDYDLYIFASGSSGIKSHRAYLIWVNDTGITTSKDAFFDDVIVTDHEPMRR